MSATPPKTLQIYLKEPVIATTKEEVGKYN